MTVHIYTVYMCTCTNSVSVHVYAHTVYACTCTHCMQALVQYVHAPVHTLYACICTHSLCMHTDTMYACTCTCTHSACTSLCTACMCACVQRKQLYLSGPIFWYSSLITCAATFVLSFSTSESVLQNSLQHHTVLSNIPSNKRTVTSLTWVFTRHLLKTSFSKSVAHFPMMFRGVSSVLWNLSIRWMRWIQWFCLDHPRSSNWWPIIYDVSVYWFPFICVDQMKNVHSSNFRIKIMTFFTFQDPLSIQLFRSLFQNHFTKKQTYLVSTMTC